MGEGFFIGYPGEIEVEGIAWTVRQDRIVRWEGGHWVEPDARTRALIEAELANRYASWERGRPVVMAAGRDITEWVVSVCDALQCSLDAGSGFLDEEQVAAMDGLAELLRFDRHPGRTARDLARRR